MSGDRVLDQERRPLASSRSPLLKTAKSQTCATRFTLTRGVRDDGTLTPFQRRERERTLTLIRGDGREQRRQTSPVPNTSDMSSVLAFTPGEGTRRRKGRRDVLLRRHAPEKQPRPASCLAASLSALIKPAELTNGMGEPWYMEPASSRGGGV